MGQVLKMKSLREGLDLQTKKPLNIKSMSPWGFSIKVSSRIKIKMRLYLYEIMSCYIWLLVTVSQPEVELAFLLFTSAPSMVSSNSEILYLFLEIVSH